MRGTSTSMFFRLWTRALRILMDSGMVKFHLEWVSSLFYDGQGENARKRNLSCMFTGFTIFLKMTASRGNPPLAILRCRQYNETVSKKRD